MLRDNLVGLIEPMGNSAGVDPLALVHCPIKSHRTIDPQCLENPRPEGAESTLSENARSPFQAEPRQEDTRNRPAEFQAQGSVPVSALIEQLRRTMEQASEVLFRLTEADLLSPFEIQGYEVNGLQAVYQVVEHFGLHYGQIAYVTKMLRGEDLGFNRELSFTGRPAK